MAALSAAAVRERYLRVREEAGPGVTVVAATKYVPLDDLAALVEAGVEVVGENRAQDLVAKHAVYGDAFRWHFIGHLQSNKATARQRRSASSSTRSTPSRPRDGSRCRRCSRSTSPARADEVGRRRPRRSAAWLERFPAIRGLMTMPPLADDPEASRPWFRRLAELAAAHGLAELSMGTSQDWRVAVEEGATLVRVGSTLFR